MTGAPAPNIGIATEPERDDVREPPSAQPLGILTGHARCSTEKQDLTAQRQTLRQLGVSEDRVYLDHGLTGRNRSRPGLNNALAALREGTPWWFQARPARPVSPPRERSEIRSRLAAFGSRLAGLSMTPAIRWASASSTSSRPSRSSRSTCCGCARELRARCRAHGVADEMPVRQRRQVCVGRRKPTRAWLLHA